MRLIDKSQKTKSKKQINHKPQNSKNKPATTKVLSLQKVRMMLVCDLFFDFWFLFVFCFFEIGNLKL
jgi:hypothetical protein